MGRFKTKRLLRILLLAPVALAVNLLITIVFVYFVFVLDMYVNTDRLSEVSYPLELYCGNVARYYKFTKGPVVFRVDRGTLVYRLNPYVSGGNLLGYAPFFIFPHHRTVILSEEAIKGAHLDVLVAHELGHIQGGLASFGTVRELEIYANDFAKEIFGNERFNLYLKYLEELSTKEPPK